MSQRLRVAYAKVLLQFRIVKAISDRELRLRAAKGVLGVATLVLEPLAMTATFMGLRLLTGAKAGHLNPVLELSLGFVPFFMFSDIAIKTFGGVAKNSRLYYYRRIRPLDTVLGEAFITIQVYGVLMLALVVGTSLWDWNFSLEKTGLNALFFIMCGVVGVGVGLNTLIIGHRLPIVAWLMKLTVRRVLVFTSCVFFPISLIPDQFRIWVLWNPLAHGIELMRHTINPAYPIPGVSVSYFVFSTIALLFFSFLIYGNNEDLLLSDEA